MEKYYRVSDINMILNKLTKEPAYYSELILECCDMK